MAKVTVCIPTYNRQKLLKFAIDSVLAQTMTDWEAIVCDDGSTDDTPDLLAGYRDDRIRYLRHPDNIGKSNNMRSGFAAATGEYFIKFDDDDRLTPEFLEKTTAILDRDRAVDFVGTDHWLINSDNQRDTEATTLNSRTWGRESLPPGIVDNLLEVVFLQQSFQVGATLFRHQALVEVDFMRPNLQNCEDNDLFVRLALAGKNAYYLPERLMEYRVHSGQEGTQRAIRYLEDKLQYLEYFQFESKKLENARRARLGHVKLTLGLRSIETGQTQRGRELLRSSIDSIGSSPKTTLGLILSYIPLTLRQWIWRSLQNLRAPNYAEKMRQ
ncbi:MAG: glycosyltransferase family 2 protein [Cyanobacteria bacterium P01_E01_bin.42]